MDYTDYASNAAVDVFGGTRAFAGRSTWRTNILLQVAQDRLHRLLDDNCEIARQVHYNPLLTPVARLRDNDLELDSFSRAWSRRAGNQARSRDKAISHKPHRERAP
jgi:hypothetical protein